MSHRVWMDLHGRLASKIEYFLTFIRHNRDHDKCRRMMVGEDSRHRSLVAAECLWCWLVHCGDQPKL